MNNKKVILIVALIGLLFSFQFSSKMEEERGIQFEQLTYKEALTKAEETGKLVFIDCYTDWCGPCKRMDRTTFKDEELGDYFSENFISIKVEMEKDEDGVYLAKRFRVRAYPTLLFVNSSGKLIANVVGMRNAEQLKDIAENVVSD